MGIATKAYLETLIATKTGLSIELKSLTGAAVDAFNRLHPRAQARRDLESSPGRIASLPPSPLLSI